MGFRAKGFTLIEMTIVIVILAIISAIAVPKFVNLSGDAKKAKIASVAADLRTAIDLIYYKALILGLENQCYDTKATPGADDKDKPDPDKDRSALVEDYFTCKGYPIAYVDSITRLISLDDEYITFNFGEKATDEGLKNGVFRDPGTYRVMIISETSEFTRDADLKGYCQIIYQPNSLEQIVVLDDAC